MNTHNAGSAKNTVSRARSLEHDGWLGRAALLVLGGGLLFALLTVAANADPAQPPSRIANIYDGSDHQPTRSVVEGRERAKGLAPSTRQQSSDDAVVEQLYQQLREGAHRG